ncbi:hypothetical protein VTO73DRAFT_10704 [Trametes versicolor]
MSLSQETGTPAKLGSFNNYHQNDIRVPPGVARYLLLALCGESPATFGRERLSKGRNITTAKLVIQLDEKIEK